MVYSNGRLIQGHTWTLPSMQPERSLKRKSSPWSDFRTNIQKVFICSRESSSSAKSACDNSTILFFEPFLQTPIFLDREWTYFVKPKHWALAFLQMDLVDITVTLCEVIFTQEDLNARDQNAELLHNAERLDRLDLHKRNALKYAAFWMINKEHDPWSYEPTETPPMISNEHLIQINMGFLKFKRVIDQGDMLFSPWLKAENDEDESGFEGGYFLGRPETPFDRQFNSNMHESLQKVLSAELDYANMSSREEIYQTVVGLFLKKQKVALNLLELSGVSTCSKAVQFLTEMAIPDSDEFTDVFFGPVQVSKTHLLILERRRHSGLAEMTRSLFRMVYRKYNNDQDPQDPHTNFESLDSHPSASVLLLSVIRGLKKLLSVCPEEENLCKFIEQCPTMEDFQSTNIFPDKHEMDDIFNRLRSAWGDVKLGSADPRNTRNDEILCDRFRQTLSLQSPAAGAIEMAATEILSDYFMRDDKDKVDQKIEVIQCRVTQEGKHIVLVSYPGVQFPLCLLHKAASVFSAGKGSSTGYEESYIGKELLTHLFTTEELKSGSLSPIAPRRKFPAGKLFDRFNLKRIGFFTHPDFQERSHALIRMVKVLNALAKEDASLSQLEELADGVQKYVIIQTCTNDKSLRENIFTKFRIFYLKSKEYDKQKNKQ